MDGLVLASVEESEHNLQSEDDVLDLLISDIDDEDVVQDPGRTEKEEIIVPSPPQGNDVNDAIEVINLSSDDSSDNCEVETHPPVKWASMWPGIGCAEWGYKQAFGSDPSFIIPNPRYLTESHRQRSYGFLCASKDQMNLPELIPPQSGI